MGLSLTERMLDVINGGWSNFPFQWLKIQGKCPLCDNKVPMSSIISFSYWIGLPTEWLKEVMCMYTHIHTLLRASALYNWFWIKENFSYYFQSGICCWQSFSSNVKTGQVSFCYIHVKSRIKGKEKNTWWTENSVIFSGFLKTFCLFWPLQAFQ